MRPIVTFWPHESVTYTNVRENNLLLALGVNPTFKSIITTDGFSLLFVEKSTEAQPGKILDLNKSNKLVYIILTKV